MVARVKPTVDKICPPVQSFPTGVWVSPLKDEQITDMWERLLIGLTDPKANEQGKNNFRKTNQRDLLYSSQIFMNGKKGHQESNIQRPKIGVRKRKLKHGWKNPKDGLEINLRKFPRIMSK